MGLEPVFMPDPTLLLSCDDWSELATGEGADSIPEKYVLLYTLNSEQKLLGQGLGRLRGGWTFPSSSACITTPKIFLACLM